MNSGLTIGVLTIYQLGKVLFLSEKIEIPQLYCLLQRYLDRKKANQGHI